MARPGWFERQRKNAANQVKGWPSWMKQALGIDKGEAAENTLCQNTDSRSDTGPAGADRKAAATH